MNLRKIAFLLAQLMLVGAVAGSALAGDGRVTVESRSSYDETVDHLTSAVNQGGMMVMAEVDQGNMLSMTGLKLKAKLFLVGNPTVGKKLFEKNTGVGLYVPLRVFVSEGKNGKVSISYDRPSSLLEQFKDASIRQTAAMLDEKLEGLTKMAAK
jgi:uncharacterized protein (DUF302 family)